MFLSLLNSLFETVPLERSGSLLVPGDPGALLVSGASVCAQVGKRMFETRIKRLKLKFFRCLSASYQATQLFKVRVEVD